MTFMHHGVSQTEVREGASSLIGRYGDGAFAVAVEQAHRSRASGDRQLSNRWAAVAWAINELTAGSATN
ncbi:MAG: hypothetical protein H7841_03335 [Magnetospirillum sp. WYHS-4]